MGQPHEHEKTSKKQDRENKIHERAGKSNEGALPARFADQFIGRAGAVLAKVLTGHAHVAAERKKAHAIVRRAALPAEKPRTKEIGRASCRERGYVAESSAVV